MYTLAWPYLDGPERERTRCILDLFCEREARDELGLSGVRESIEDHLFPFYSTIQTLLRDIHFAPWCCNAFGQQPDPRRIALIKALKRGCVTCEVLGCDTGQRSRPLSSDIHWSRARRRCVRRNRGDGTFGLRAAAAPSSEDHPVRSSSLPKQPDDGFEITVFRLSREEADFSIDWN